MVSRLFLICCAVLAATSSVHALPVDLGTSLEERAPSADGGQQSAPPIDEFAIDENLSASMAKIADMTIPPEKTAQATNGTTPKTNVKLTYYWLAYQPKTDTGDVELRSCNGKTLFGKASLKFAKKIRMEGSGHLANGKMLNLGSCNCADGTNTFNCFIDITKNKKAPFGYGVKNLPLVPFVSVANNDKEFEVGSWLYAADFDGIKLPNGKVHNGCLQKVDAIGRGGDKNHIDVFALTESVYKKTFSPKIKKSKIGVEWGSSKCDQNKVKGYGITPEMSFD